MATLIQSKQIEGVVTASVIEGTFTVQSGSVNLQDATGVTGSFSGSFVGDGSQLTFKGTGLVSGSEQINYNLLQNKPLFIGDGGTTITSGSGNIIISSSNTGIGVSSFNDLTDVPAGLISGSGQLPDGIVSQSAQVVSLLPDGVISGSGQLPSGIFSGSGQLPGGIFSGSGQLPSGLVSESAQVVSLLPDGVVSGSTQITNGSNIFSGSVVAGTNITITSGSGNIIISSSAGGGVTSYDDLTDVPSDIISSSAQISALGFVTSTGTDAQTLSINQITNILSISNGNSVDLTPIVGGDTDISGSIWSTSSYGDYYFVNADLQVTGSLSATSLTGSIDYSNLTNAPSGIISGSGQLPSGLVSQSAQTIIHLRGTNIFSGSGQLPDGLVSSSTQIPSLLPDGVISGSGQLPGGIFSGSGQLPDGIVSSSTQIPSLLPDGVISGSGQLPSGIFSGSGQLPGGIFSGSGQLPDGIVSSSTQISSFNTFLEINGDGVVSSSQQIIDSLPSGVISGSGQLPSGIFSSSAQLPSGIFSGSGQLPSGLVSESAQTIANLNGTNIFSGSLLPGANVTITSGSGNITITAANDGTSDFNNLINVPDGLVSSSNQLTSSYDTRYLNTNGDGVVSGSVLRTLNGTGVISGSVLRTLDGTGVISGSVLRPNGDGVVSGSVLRTLNSTGVFSGSLVAGTNITINQDGNNFEISSSASGGSTSVTVSDSAPNSPSEGDLWWKSNDGNLYVYYDGYWVISNDITAGLPAGVVSGSSQLTSSYDTRYLNTNGDDVVSGSVLRPNGDGVVSGSVLRTLDGTGVFSGSSQLPDGIVSSSTQIPSLLPDGVISGSGQLPSGIFSGSGQLPDGIVSQSAQVVSLLPDGVISGSSQIVYRYTLGASGINHYTFTGNGLTGAENDPEIFLYRGFKYEFVNSSGGHPFQLQTTENGALGSPYQDGVSGAGGDYIASNGETLTINVQFDAPDTLYYQCTSHNNMGGKINIINVGGGGASDSGIVSTSQQVIDFLPDGVVSGSEQITNGSNIFSGSVVAGTNITITSGSGNIIISSSAGGGVSSFNDLTDVPSGIVSSSNQTIAHTSGSGIISSSEQLTSTFLEINGDGVVSSSQQIIDSLPDGVVSGSTQITNGSGIFSGSLLPGEGITIASGSGNISISASFDGNRTVSNTDLPSGIYNNNFGTSGSIQNFIEAVFFPNTAPSISTGNQTILEFSGSGDTIVTLSATDAEGQSLTFGTASAYTDDLVRVASDGEMTLNALATSASFNTDSVGGGHGHLVTVTATDTFDAVTEKDIYIIVTPNEAPKFRETSISGNVITSVTANLNENSADDTLVKRVFFTDAEGDTITITTSSIDNEHFDVTIYGTYLDIRQNTGSLDYDQQTSYTFSITASDEHYENSQDSDSRTFLPVTINVTDNNAPTVNNQVVGSINENSSDGTVVGTVSVSDSEGDSVSAPFFQLHKLYLDGVEVNTGSYGGTSQATDPHENAFEINSGNRQITRKNSVYLNSDLVNRYDYRVKVKDNFNAQISSASVVTININDDVAATLTDNWSAGPYIIESAVNGRTIKVNSNGRTGTQADYGSNQSGTWSSSNPAISIASNGGLSVGLDISGSGTGSGDTIDSVITFTNTFGTTTTDNLSVSVTTNEAPTVSSTSTSNLNTNQATGSATLLQLGINDAESDAIPNSALSFEGYNTTYFTPTINSSTMFLSVNNTSVPAGTYPYTASMQDEHGFRTNKESGSFTIAQADTGTLGGDTTSYIIESGESGDVIRDASGFGAGNQSQLTVSYSPNYGSQVVQGSSWASSNPAVAINTSGQLSLALDISGSDTGSGDDIVSTISFQDQYGNSGTGTVTVNVFANQAPTATFTDQSANFETDLAIAGKTMVSMSISDTESDTPFSASLTGTNASDLQLKYVGSNSASVGIQAASSLAAGTYNYNVKITDNFNKSRTYSGRSFTIVQSADYGKTYVYRSNYGSDAGLSSNYNAVMGASTVSSDTPPEVTAYTANDTSPYRLISSSLGDASLSLAGGKTATRVAILSGSDLDTIISESNPFTMGNTAEQYLIIVPSGSDMIGIPTSMTDGFGDNTVGRYVMAVKADGGSWGQEPSTIHLLDTSGSFNGYDKHFVIGRNGHNSAASVEIRIIEASGSLPS